MKLTAEGKARLENEINEKKEELRRLGRYKGGAAGDEGDGFHDNFAFEQTEIKERSLRYTIAELEKKLATAEVIVEEERSVEKLGVGSNVKLRLRYAEDDEEEVTLKITDYLRGDERDTISISSPLGKCIYNKEEGFVGKYSANGNIVEVEILSISNFEAN